MQSKKESLTTDHFVKIVKVKNTKLDLSLSLLPN